MQHDTGPTRWWRPALCWMTILWLAGHMFFPEGHTHLKVFWCFLVPLLLLNLDAIPPLRRINPWFAVLGVLLLWQVAVSARYSLHPLAIGGLLDALSLVLLLLAVGIVARTPHGWNAFRWTLFAVAVATMAWSLLSFYPIRGVALAAERFRNVLVYPEYLNPVLTGLLAAFGMVIGTTLDATTRVRWQRAVLWPGIAVLAFAMMASQSRGALLAAGAGTVALLLKTRFAALRGIIAAGAGIITFIVAFAAFGADEAVPDLVSRGSSGRFDIWEVYLGQLRGIEWLFGEGFAAPIDQSVLGWHVHHPHSSVLTQLVHSGIPGLLLLLTFSAGAAWCSWRNRDIGTSALPILVFGLTGLLMDGAQVVSLFSLPRIENLLVLVPAVFALSHRQGRLSQPSGGQDPDPAPGPS